MGSSWIIQRESIHKYWMPTARVTVTASRYVWDIFSYWRTLRWGWIVSFVVRRIFQSGVPQQWLRVTYFPLRPCVKRSRGNWEPSLGPTSMTLVGGHWSSCLSSLTPERVSKHSSWFELQLWSQLRSSEWASSDPKCDKEGRPTTSPDLKAALSLQS